MNYKSVELIQVALHTLQMCTIRKAEQVILYTDTSKTPEIVDAFFAAAHSLAGEAIMVMRTPQPVLAEPPDSLRDLLKGADMVLDMATNPWLYTYALNAILDGGTRVLQVNSSVKALRNLTPTDWKVDRTEVGAALFHEAREIEIWSSTGTSLYLRCDGRPGWGQDGIVRNSGEWDSSATNILAVAPIEDSLEGTLVIDPGDTLSARPIRKRLRESMTLTLEKGRITKITGGYEANQFQNWLASWDDPNSYVVSHTGFGLDPRAQPDDPSEWESIEGGINVAFGSNLFRGLAGRNHARSHVDIVLLRHSMRINGNVIVNKGRVVDPELVHNPTVI